MYTRHTELRRLHERDEYNLALKLNERDCWRLMKIIPHRLNAQQNSNNATLDWQEAIANEGVKYRHEHFELMQNAFRASGGTRLISQILLDEWKTSGRKEERPTLGVLLQLLVGAKCWMAADFLATELLHEAKPDRPLDGPDARFDFPVSEFCADIEEYVNDASSYPDTEALNFSVNGVNSTQLHNNRDYRTKFMLDKQIIMPQIGVSTTANVNAHEASTAEMVIKKQAEQTQTMSTQERQTATTNTQSGQNKTTTTATHDIPLLSTLMTSQTSTVKSTDKTSSIAETTSDTNTLSDAQKYAFLIEAPIPNLSILALSSNDAAVENNGGGASAAMANEILPVLSDLYLCNEVVNTQHDVNMQHASLPPGSSLSSSSSSSSLSNVGRSNEDDDVDAQSENRSVPNLSIFEQHSSNNDSSLTSVTGTSGENSFELSVAPEEQQPLLLTTKASSETANVVSSTEPPTVAMEACDSELQSFQNIPCLSALKQ